MRSWLEVAGALFVVWLVLVFLFTPHSTITSAAARLTDRVSVYEYRATMTHAKLLISDGVWAWEQIARPFVWILERQQ